MFADLHARLTAGGRITRDEAAWLWQHADDAQLRALAGLVRARWHAPDAATWLIMAIVNYTNVCDVYCKFCAFYRTETDPDHYVLSHEQIDRKIDELVAVGGNQILLQGGHHPKLGLEWYLDLLQEADADPVPGGESSGGASG